MVTVAGVAKWRAESELGMPRNQSEKATRRLQHPNWHCDWIASVVEEDGVWGVRLKIEKEQPGATETLYFKAAPTYDDALKLLGELPQRIWFDGHWVVPGPRQV